MAVSKWAMVVFFLAFGISFFVPFSYSGLIEAIAALIAGIALILNK